MTDNTQTARLTRRIRLALNELSLPPAAVKQATPRLVRYAQFLDRPPGRLTDDDGFFAFDRKVQEVVDRLGTWGLTRSEYVQAGLRQPSLFYFDPDRVVAKVHCVVALFEREGVTAVQYIRCALRQPQLFYQSPETILQNIEGVVSYLGRSGLDRATYINCAIRSPQLFAAKPRTVAAKFQKVCAALRQIGLGQGDYLRAMIQQPSLFGMSADTVVRNIGTVLQLYQDGVIDRPIRVRASSRRRDTVEADMIAAVLRAPQILCMSQDNFRLRRLYQRVTGCPPSFQTLLIPRRRVESELRKAFGDRLPRGRAGAIRLLELARQAESEAR